MSESNRLLMMAEGLANFGHWRHVAGSERIERSARASVILGLGERRRLSPKAALMMVDPADRWRVLRCLAQARRRDRQGSCDARIHCADGELRHVRIQAQADSGAGESIDGMFGIIRDITSEVAIESRLTAARDDAQAATRAKSEFLATMSHEIRTPMTGVIGMIELLEANPRDEERQLYLSAMKQSAELLMSVLDGILDYSKVESGKFELVNRDFDFTALVRRTADMFQNNAAKKGLGFKLAIDTGLSPIAHADPVRLQQVLSNLLSNAVKFTSQGEISVSLKGRPCGDARQRWRVTIKDTGIGIDPTALGQLFEPFVQAGDRRLGGTGLGLAISRRLIKAMGGRTAVSSSPGRGSTFWFEVDLPVGAMPAPSPGIVIDQVPAQRHLHVLIAEDNAINQMLIAALVRRLGHRATCVDNGRRAMESARAVPFDCILMDMQMPEMDGVAATKAIRSLGGRNARIPIIALTADVAPERRRFYEHIGLTAFMAKPIGVDRLGQHLTAIATAPAIVQDRPAPHQSGIDYNHVAELRATLGDNKVQTLIAMLATELTDSPLAIRAAAAREDLLAVRGQAHSFKGAVASLGLTGVARAAKAVELALLGAELELALERLEEAVADARLMIPRLLDDPPLPAKIA